MKRLNLSFRGGLAAVVFFLMASTVPCRVQAQTGAALLVKPWPDKNQVSDGSADAYFFNEGHTRQSNSGLQLYDFESSGRFRIIPGNEISPRIGYDFTILDNHTHNRRLPDQLSDESIAVGTGVAKWGTGWVAGVTLGVGYAGSKAFGEGTGWYGKADVVVAKEFDDNNAVGFIIDYDGNRSYYPDSPLPGIGFSHRFDPKLQVVAGLPYSSLSWKPLCDVDIEAEYQLFEDFKFSVGYEFIRGWTAYGSYNFVRDAFHTDDLGKDRRLLFFQRRAELGIRYSPIESLKLNIAIGYGWDGSYRSGYDFDKNSLVADLSDEPYVRGGLTWNF